MCGREAFAIFCFCHHHLNLTMLGTGCINNAYFILVRLPGQILRYRIHVLLEVKCSVRKKESKMASDNFTRCHTRDRAGRPTGHIIQTPTQPVGSGNRTHDLLTRSRALYRLSYRDPRLSTDGYTKIVCVYVRDRGRE